MLDCGEGVRLSALHANQEASNGPAAARLVVLLHGWEGSANSLYVLSLGQYLFDRGYDVLRLNLRDHGDSHHLNEGIFHSCRIAEVVGAVRCIQDRNPGPRRESCGVLARRQFLAARRRARCGSRSRSRSNRRRLPGARPRAYARAARGRLGVVPPLLRLEMADLAREEAARVARRVRPARRATHGEPDADDRPPRARAWRLPLARRVSARLRRCRQRARDARRPDPHHRRGRRSDHPRERSRTARVIARPRYRAHRSGRSLWILRRRPGRRLARARDARDARVARR